MDETEFKKKHKFPACTTAPWQFLIPFKERPEVMRKIKQETIDLYGEDMTECPKRKVCIGKDCIGRPLPWNSPTAKPYLDKLKATQKITNDELFITGCNGCPIAKTCSKSCPTVNDFVNRNKSEEPNLIYQPYANEKQLERAEEEVEVNRSVFNGADIPWDCITFEQRDIVKTYLYEQRDFKYIADKFKLNNQANVKYLFYAALTKMSEVAVMRKFYEENKAKLTYIQDTTLWDVYFDNLSMKEVADIRGVSKQAISNVISRVVVDNNIRWTKFVTKRRNKIIYNVPEIMK